MNGRVGLQPYVLSLSAVVVAHKTGKKVWHECGWNYKETGSFSRRANEQGDWDRTV